MARIGVLGGGAWGTALAAAAVRAGHEVTVWAREAETVAAINAGHENTAFLPGIALAPAVRATEEAAEAVRDAAAVLVVTPAQHTRAVLGTVADGWPAELPAVVCAKGIEIATGTLLSDAVAETLPGRPVAILSGPTFAHEVARGLPAAVTLAAADARVRDGLVALLGSGAFRPYASDDVVGAQIGGALKNVMAIACGIVAGKGLGENARAALMTRGLAELVRLGTTLGGRAETLMGLSGMGDLVLTCSSLSSRNFSLGHALGEGAVLADILAGRTSVAEGVHTAEAAALLARRHRVDMPIAVAMSGILHNHADVDACIQGLLARPFKHEVTGAPVDA